MKILMSGGGTAGSVAPLIALIENIKKQEPETKFLFIGTKKGLPEKKMIKSLGISYSSIYSGKFRRYFDWRNCFDLFLIFIGFIQSFFLIKKFKPNISISAGGFVSVPVNFAAFIFKVPILIHQQDIVPGLANKLIAPFAKKITVTFEKSLSDFSKKKTILIGNPIRSQILNGDKNRAIQEFGLESNLPTILIFGGGTGSRKINEIVFKIIPELIKFCQVIHLTGKGKSKNINYKIQNMNRYHQYEFLLDKMADAYAVADLVISRAGLNSLTELSILGKPAILIPIAKSHQVVNAKYFSDRKAVVLLNENNLSAEFLLKKIHKLIFSSKERSLLSLNISKLIKPDAVQRLSKIILQ